MHIGSGRVYLPGWVNVDIFSSVRADVYADMASLPFERESFDLLYASHVLEHSNRLMVLATLSHWRDLLKIGGILRLAVPDFAKCVAWYNETEDLPSITGLLFGGQNHPKNNHFITFDEATLRRALTQVGFHPSNIKWWDWRTTDHGKFDDYSQCRLPHMSDSDETIWMSLNLEAIK